MDLPRVLVDMGAVDGYDEMRFYTVIWPLPLRLNPDLPANPHLPLFYRQVDDLEGAQQSWICYADGSSGVGRTPEHLDSNWYPIVTKAGYPILSWKSFDEEQRWLDQNRGRLEWDAAARVYAVKSRTISATTAPAHDGAALER
jgi:hypothetical protein